jgi:hypothetical protein
MKKERERCIPVSVAIAFGIIFGIITALIWGAGLAPLIREMIPYVIAFEIIVAAVTALISSKNGYFKFGYDSCEHPEPCYKTIKNYTATILITAAISILVGLIILATFLPFIFRLIFAFTGGIAFWINLISFVIYIICLSKKAE